VRLIPQPIEGGRHRVAGGVDVHVPRNGVLDVPFSIHFLRGHGSCPRLLQHRRRGPDYIVRAPVRYVAVRPRRRGARLHRTLLRSDLPATCRVTIRSTAGRRRAAAGGIREGYDLGIPFHRQRGWITEQMTTTSDAWSSSRRNCISAGDPDRPRDRPEQRELASLTVDKP